MTNLAEHLASLVTPEQSGTKAQAANILQDPQAHIDALVEAGVLREHTYVTDRANFRYEVVQPHEHDWRFDSSHVGSSSIVVKCAGYPHTRPVYISELSKRVP